MSKARVLIPVVAVLSIGGWLIYRQWLHRHPMEWSGTVEARTIGVGSRVGGRVKQVLVKEGAHVEAGQALVEFEAGDLQARMALAQGELAQARANAEKLQRGARAEEIAASEARLRGAESTVEYSRRMSERAATLAEQDVMTQEQRDQAESAYQEAIARRDAEREQLAELRNGSRPEDLAIAKAQVDVAAARVEELRVQIGELTVSAPVAARVEALDLRPGDLVAANAKTAVLLEDDQLFVRIYVPETQLRYIAIGAHVPVFTDSFPDQPFTGTVEYINEVGEFSPRNLQTADERANQVFATKITVAQDARSHLRAGMAAFVRVKP